MPDASSRRLIVSLTSFPARIACVPQVLERLFAQTRPADRIVLYLSADQFPGREADLPEELRQAAAADRFLLRWVDGDLKPHKKYFYAFREYPEDIVVTVDDDALYDPALLDILWQTHLKYPDAVVAGRTHLITTDASGQPRPYGSWLRRVTGFEEGPSMQLFAVGIGGVLYDPKWFPQELYDEQVIRDTCLLADDLWLKTMEMAAGIPVVSVSGTELLRTIPGSQETALCSANVGENRNDEIFSAIRRWANAYYGRDLVAEQLENDRWPRVRGEKELLDYMNSDKQRLMNAANASIAKIQHQLQGRLDRSQKKVEKLEKDIALIRSSSSYKLGHALLSPLNRIRGKKDS